MGVPLYRYLNPEADLLPLPMVNIISGGLHAGRNLEFQDFLVVPVGAERYGDALRMVEAVYRSVGEELRGRGEIAQLVAEEGGYGPRLGSDGGWAARFGGPLVGLLESWNLPGEKVARDLQVLERSARRHLAEKAVAALAGLLAPQELLEEPARRLVLLHHAREQGGGADVAALRRRLGVLVQLGFDGGQRLVLRLSQRDAGLPLQRIDPLNAQLAQARFDRGALLDASTQRRVAFVQRGRSAGDALLTLLKALGRLLQVLAMRLLLRESALAQCRCLLPRPRDDPLTLGSRGGLCRLDRTPIGSGCADRRPRERSGPASEE